MVPESFRVRFLWWPWSFLGPPSHLRDLEGPLVVVEANSVLNQKGTKYGNQEEGKDNDHRQGLSLRGVRALEGDQEASCHDDGREGPEEDQEEGSQEVIGA